MRNLYSVFLTCAALLLLSSLVVAETRDHDDSMPAISELLALKSTDGRNHEVLAIAMAKSGNTDILYVVEGVSDRYIRGSEDNSDGEYLLWKLKRSGQVLCKEFIRKMPPRDNRPPPCVTVIPLPAPQEGAIVVGIFDGEFVWSFNRVDRAGKITLTKKLINVPNAFLSAVLLPDAKGLLLAGQYGFGGNVWKVDLEGKVIWKKTYKSKTDMSQKSIGDKVASQFYSIALTDDTGGFIVAGDFGKLNKFGMGQKSIWLIRCDEAGNILTETTFPGRIPKICSIGRDRFAISYDAGIGFDIIGRVRGVNLELKKLWDNKVQIKKAILPDEPAISSLPSDRGFVLAGCNIAIGKEKKIAKFECRTFQYDARGQIVSSATIPVAKKGTTLYTRVTCGYDCMYIAIQTKGMVPWDIREAGIFEMPLKKQNQ